MRDGNASGSGHGDGGTDSRHDLERNSRGAQGQRLFAATAEDEGIAALQSHNLLALARVANQQRLDLALIGAMFARPLADINQFRAAGGEFQQLVVCQFVEENRVGGFETALTLERQQLRIPRPGADEINLAERICRHR